MALLEVAPPAPHRRIPALDAARALGVVAMVVGHTVDAVLAPADRATAAMTLYWKARGLTAPLFLLVSGWALTVAIRRSGARGAGVVVGRLPRVALLLLLGIGLRWPGWGLARLGAGDIEVWEHLLAFDALHTIAIALLAASAVLAVPATTRERAFGFALLLVLAVALGLRAPAPIIPDRAALSAMPAALALAQAVGGTSPFPIFPWTAYVFAGCLVGLLAGDARGRTVVGLAAVGGGLVAATVWTGVGKMPSCDPRLVAFRVGAVLLVLALLTRVPAGLAMRLAPLGRASLGVYAIHVPIVYGWSTHAGLAQRVGSALPLATAAATALVVLAASLGLHHALAGAGRAVAALGSRAAAWPARLAPPG